MKNNNKNADVQKKEKKKFWTPERKEKAAYYGGVAFNAFLVGCFTAAGSMAVGAAVKGINNHGKR